MQGLHHQQQQLAALLNAALPKDDPNATTSSSITTGAASDEDESDRVAAINSIHRAVVYPHNSLLVTHSASFLSQGFSQLLSDKYVLLFWLYIYGGLSVAFTIIFQ